MNFRIVVELIIEAVAEAVVAGLSKDGENTVLTSLIVKVNPVGLAAVFLAVLLHQAESISRTGSWALFQAFGAESLGLVNGQGRGHVHLRVHVSTTTEALSEAFPAAHTGDALLAFLALNVVKIDSLIVLAHGLAVVLHQVEQVLGTSVGAFSEASGTELLGLLNRNAGVDWQLGIPVLVVTEALSKAVPAIVTEVVNDAFLTVDIVQRNTEAFAADMLAVGLHDVEGVTRARFRTFGKTSSAHLFSLADFQHGGLESFVVIVVVIAEAFSKAIVAGDAKMLLDALLTDWIVESSSRSSAARALAVGLHNLKHVVRAVVGTVGLALNTHLTSFLNWKNRGLINFWVGITHVDEALTEAVVAVTTEDTNLASFTLIIVQVDSVLFSANGLAVALHEIESVRWTRVGTLFKAGSPKLLGPANRDLGLTGCGHCHQAENSNYQF